MAMIDMILGELEQEAQATRRLLERIPENRLSWKPHPRSFSLGQIALHVAELPAAISTVAAEDVYAVPTFEQREAGSRAELLEAWEHGLKTARAVLGPMSDQRLADTWRLQDGEQVVMALPRAALLRSLLLNHYYHHRGQLTVYLRLLDIPLPSTYGPTADENPFAPSPETAGV